MARAFVFGAALTGTILLGQVQSVACWTSSKMPPVTRGTFTSMYVNVEEQDSAQVRVVLVDRNGRRSGETERGRVEEISGCRSGGGLATDMFNDEYVPTDSAGAPLDTVPVDTSLANAAEAEAWAAFREHSVPKYYDFTVFHASGTSGGIIDQGECELRLEPSAPGPVTLAFSAEGVGFSMCKDTTSVVVRRGVPLRWKLTWKSDGHQCDVKVKRIGVRASN